MKKTIIFSIIMLIFSEIYSQETLAKDPKATEILDKVSKKTKSFETIRIKFSYTLENTKANAKETYTGYAFLKGNKYKLILAGTDIFTDGKNLYSYLKDAQEMTITLPKEDDDNIFNPAKLFTVYEKGFKYQYLGEETENSKKFEIIDLFPEQVKKKNYSRIRLKIDAKELIISSIKSFGKDGNHYTIDVTEFKTNLKMPENLFEYDSAKYPGEVIDLRNE